MTTGGRRITKPRTQIYLPDELLKCVEDYRFSHRIPSQAAAVRELIKLGLVAAAGGVL